MQHHDVGVLRGHKRPVNCLAKCLSGAPDLLASGSQDSTVRIWDLRTNKVAQCITQVFAGDAVSSVAFPSATDLYVASHNQLYTFDLRNTGMIVKEATTILEPAADEINTLAVHPSHAKKPWLAVPDDEGEIGIVNLQTKALQTTLRGQHTNLCMSAAFRPKCAGYDLVTGGHDCQLVFWEMNGDRCTGRMRAKLSMQDIIGDDALADGTQMWNPPFVYDVAFNAAGRSLAAALGDGSVVLLDFASRSLQRRLTAHRAVATCVEFAAWQGKEYLISAANDATVAIWDYKAAIQSADEAATMVPLANRPNAIATHVNANGCTLYVGDDRTATIALIQLH
ncbi:hypothetical protein SPRG_11098 [Saprolegnia parasitica CBS 223.65]|uniref:Uncharacterized protein n=1 Tax=Saprolegnia parasitica (strain CBS 223.65) TaxID=695850 RepID=A0A067C3F2_SAPPC|nr:hypothetical protein SPRG_11098 [Saprolegnia parasitica CBS 223.65]KDO23650.1 hypothetical protein SPRG_11098 [Saprolegnia parasitica CBS 223.65]|eukprot:XP_012205633.1 hypothetical protein SPRG_11098 [Saprolegnia parasitica CBS 223.65]